MIQICDLRCRLEAVCSKRGSISIALVTVSNNAHEWHTDPIQCSLGVYGWTEGVEKTFRQPRVFVSGRVHVIDNAIQTTEELQRYLSPDGFLFLRASLGDGETALGKFRLLRNHR